MNKADRLRLAAVETNQQAERDDAAKKETARKRGVREMNERAKHFSAFVTKTVDERAESAVKEGKFQIEYSNWGLEDPWPWWDFGNHTAIKKLIKTLKKQGFVVEAYQNKSEPSTDPDWMGRVDTTVRLKISWE